MHTKTIDGVHDQQTYSGAVITIVTALVVFLLISSEFSAYMSVEVSDRMVADTTVGVSDVTIEFDLEFEHVACDKITFSQEVTRGTLHSHEPEHISKNPIEATSCWVHGSIVTDKVGGSFRFMIEDANQETIGNGPNSGTRELPHLATDIRYG